MAFVFACKVSDLKNGGALQIENGSSPVAVFNVDGRFHAIGDTCSHGNWSLSEGYVENGAVECSLHRAKFCLRTGAVLAPPARIPARVYPVKVEDGDVLVDLTGGCFHDSVKPTHKNKTEA